MVGIQLHAFLKEIIYFALHYTCFNVAKKQSTSFKYVGTLSSVWVTNLIEISIDHKVTRRIEFLYKCPQHSCILLLSLLYIWWLLMYFLSNFLWVFPSSYYLFSMTVLSACNINLKSEHCLKFSLSEAQKVFGKLHQENKQNFPQIFNKNSLQATKLGIFLINRTTHNTVCYFY